MDRKEYIKRLLELADNLRKLIISSEGQERLDLVVAYLETLKLIREFGLL